MKIKPSVTATVAARTVRWLSLVSVVALVAMGLSAAPAAAETWPGWTEPITVSADGLPTWQINGVVWSQAIVGNTVYVAGNFTKARPPGVAVGGVGEVDANYAFAYDITTGNRVASFQPQLNAQANVVRAAPDGKRVYFGGDFTTVDGVTRSHVAAFDTVTNTLVASFKPIADSRVAAIAVSADTVYLGGFLSGINGASRAYLGAVTASAGALVDWTPQANDAVESMVMAPDNSRVIIGGRFTTINDQYAWGMGAVDAQSGIVLRWDANQRITAADQGAITSLRTDGTQIFGSAWAFGTGAKFEGTFGVDPYTGVINFVNDCHGDTYDVFPSGEVLYTASHVHTCEWIGSFKNTDPWTLYFANAFLTRATTVNTGPDDYGWDYSGLPASSLLTWYPSLVTGKYTGQGQAGWSLTGNDSYVAFGGEFPYVNGVAQQGLVRFPATNIAPNKQGPVYSAVLAPAGISISKGTARISWRAGWDKDNRNLTYKLLRDASLTPIYTTTADSSFFELPVMHFTDSGLTPGLTHTYRVQAVDPFGNRVTSPYSDPITITSASLSPYAEQVLADGAMDYWRLGEPTGTTGYNYSGFTNLTKSTGVGHADNGAIDGDADGASTFDGTSAGMATTTSPVEGPNLFSIEAWFATTTTRGGKLVGFGNASSGNSSSYDRHIYMDNTGHITFGVYNNGVYTIRSPKTYNDGAYHQVVGTLAPSGLTLFIDGVKIGSNGGTSVGQAYAGYWRLGQDNLNGWPDGPASNAFAGTIDDVAVYPTAVSLATVQQHFLDSGRTLTIAPAPKDVFGAAVYAAEPDLFWRLDDLATPTVADTSRNENPGVYAGGVTLGEASPVAASTGTAVGFDGVDGTIGSASTFTNPTVYTESAWFTTTTTHGGKIIGFGNEQSGYSNNYDRHVYMENSGQLTFGVWTGAANIATTSLSYNDGKWHQVVATQDATGMKLYVDGALVATNPQTQAQAYTGYWRVGGDSDWGGDSAFLNGTIDEVAIWNSTALSVEQINTIYRSSPASVVNASPIAVIADPECVGLSCTFDGSASTDADGTIASYVWDFGDGGAGSTEATSHEFATDGSYLVSLTVTDDAGATGTVNRLVTVSTKPPVNASPIAVIADPECVGLSCTFDGSASTDADGTIASYVWDFGDGGSASTVTATHAYTTSGTYAVTLRVTDNSGVGDSATRQVTVTQTPPPAQFLALDTFTRSVTNGWGTSETGGPWSTAAASSFAVNGGVGSLTMARAGSGPSIYLNNVSSSSTDAQVTVTADKASTGGGIYASLVGRRVTGIGDYRAKVRITSTNGVGISLAQVGWNGTQTTLTTETIVPGLTAPAGTSLRIRLQVTGTDPTTVRAKVWMLGTTEPTAWQATATDSSAGMQARGGIGIIGYLSGSATNSPVTQRYDDLLAVPVDGTVPPNAVPTAVIAAPVCTGLSCSFDGSGSSDSDGTVTAYSWNFGDGATASTVKPSHIYAAAGGYSVTLTVTDNAAATGSATRSVTVTTPPPNVPPMAVIATPLCTGLSCSFDGSGSSDSDGTVTAYAWNFGDGATASAANPTHTYATAGSYSVTLMVTDNNAATGSAEAQVTVTAPPGPSPFFASDTFARVFGNGWGTADVGGGWSTTAASSFAVNGSVGSLTMARAGSGPSIYLTGVSSDSSDVQVSVTVDKPPTGGGIYASLVGRRIIGAGDYRAKVRITSTGGVGVSVAEVTAAGVQNVLTPEVFVSGLTFTPGTVLRIRLQVDGTQPTNLRARVWKAGTSEPTTWLVSASDATAGMQGPGGLGVIGYLSGSATNSPVMQSYDDLQAGPVQ